MAENFFDRRLTQSRQPRADRRAGRLEVDIDPTRRPGTARSGSGRRSGSRTDPLRGRALPEVDEKETDDCRAERPLRRRAPVCCNGQILPAGHGLGSGSRPAADEARGRPRPGGSCPILADAVPGWFQADADALRRGGPRDGLRRRLPRSIPIRCCVAGPGGRRVRPRDPRRDLPRPRGLRLPVDDPRGPAGGGRRASGPAEPEPNDTPGTATVPRLARCRGGADRAAGDVDFDRVEGRAGKELVAEVQARRSGSPSTPCSTCSTGPAGSSR